MSEPFLGQININAFGFAPKGWALCNGQLLPINQNQALFSLLGTQYGGDGRTTFALPDFRGRAAVHRGAGLEQGQTAGAESVTLTDAQMPLHSHALMASADFAISSMPGNALPAARPRGGLALYATGGRPARMTHPGTVGVAGASQAHPNMQPFNTLNFVIAMAGIFPSRN